MKVKFFAYIRDNDYAGCKEISIPACRDLRQLGELLAERYGRKMEQLYFSPDKSTFGEQAIILVNGRRAEFLKGIDTELSEEDTVLVFPVVAGG